MSPRPAGGRRRVAACFPFAGDTFGGSVVSAALLMEGLAARGVDLVVPVHGRGRALDHLRDRGFEILPLPPLGRIAEEDRPDRFRPGNVLAFGRVLRLLSAGRLDLVHLNDKRMIRTWSLPAALSRRPVVAHWRSTYTPSLSVDLGLRLAAAVPCISQKALAGLPVFARAKAEVVPNPFAPPVDEARRQVDRARVRAAAGIPAEAGVVGFFGAFSRRKRPSVLLDILEGVPATADGRPVFGVACGAPARPADEAFLAALVGGRAEGRLVVPGSVPDPLAWMAACDVVVMPSVSEPFGRVAVEAWSAGAVPVVSSDSGVAEAVADGEDGFVLPPDDLAGWIGAVRRVLDDGALARRLAEGGRTAARRFGADAHAERILDLYGRVLGRVPLAA